MRCRTKPIRSIPCIHPIPQAPLNPPPPPLAAAAAAAHLLQVLSPYPDSPCPARDPALPPGVYDPYLAGACRDLYACWRADSPSEFR